MVMTTAGLANPYDISFNKIIMSANAAPIAKGLPVAKMTYTKNIDAINSTKYVYIIDDIYITEGKIEDFR